LYAQLYDLLLGFILKENGSWGAISAYEKKTKTNLVNAMMNFMMNQNNRMDNQKRHFQN